MTSKQVTQYRCDFCGKTGLRKGHMVRHENICTMNPTCDCRVCHNLGQKPMPLESLMAPLARLSQGFYGGIPDEEAFKLYHLMSGQLKGAIEQIRDLAGGCPPCMLAALRQSKIPMGCFDWDYKEEHRKFWNEVNAERAD